MAETKWFYYLHEEGNVIVRLNSDAFEWRLGEIGFQKCSYQEYLKARKSIKERELSEARKRYVEGMANDGDE